MKHVVVTRVTCALCGLFVAVAFAFARVANRPAPQGRVEGGAVVEASGARLFESRCASCHTVGDVVEILRGAPDADRHELEFFLASHGEASAPERRAILAYLSGLAGW